MPVRKHSAILRRKNDERVEAKGVVSKIYQHRAMNYDDFDDPLISIEQPVKRIKAIIGRYQVPKDVTGDTKGREEPNYPFIGTFRWRDGVKKLDLVEVPYEYAQRAGLSNCVFGEVEEPNITYYTRFKLVNKKTKGINSDVMLQFFLAPTEEDF
jgi:hypothetical protein